MRHTPLTPFTLLFLLLSGGCATPSRVEIFSDVQSTLTHHLDSEIIWKNKDTDEGKLQARINQLLSEPLTPKSAVQIALLNNRGLQATFEALGVARADLLEASSIPNPLLSVSERVPGGGGRGNIEFGVTENFLNILYLPLRMRLAGEALEGAKARVSHEVLDLAALVKTKLYELQGALQTEELLRLTLLSYEASTLAETKIHDAGNSTDLDLAREQVLFEETKLEISRSHTEIELHREALNMLLGVSGDAIKWTTVKELPAIPQSEIDLSNLEKTALEERLDLEALQKEVNLAADEEGIAIPKTLFTESQVGIDTERDSSGGWVTGPNISVPFPLFSLGESAKERASAKLTSTMARYQDRKVQIQSEVRSARERLLGARDQALRLHKVILPLRQAIIKHTQERYNGMLASLFTLLEAKRNEIDTQKEYVKTAEEYWKAYAELERAIGRTLPSPTVEPRHER